MDVRIKTTDYQLTPGTSEYLDERVRHIEKLLGEDASQARCEIEIGRDGHAKHGANIWVAEIQVSYPGGRIVRATNHSESVNGAIDDAKAELERQMREEKKVQTSFLKRSGMAAKRLLRLD